MGSRKSEKEEDGNIEGCGEYGGKQGSRRDVWKREFWVGNFEKVYRGESKQGKHSGNMARELHLSTVLGQIVVRGKRPMGL